ncbi:UNVERIFIED_CONTAM: hypothetical protein RMT77_008203 [Armadillidium vulgare]
MITILNITHYLCWQHCLCLVLRVIIVQLSVKPSMDRSITLFPANGWVYVWRTPKEACHPDCRFPSVKHRGGFVYNMGGHILYSADPIITINGWITANEYIEILNDEFLTMTSILLPSITLLQDDDDDKNRSFLI